MICKESCLPSKEMCSVEETTLLGSFHVYASLPRANVRRLRRGQRPPQKKNY